MLGNGSDSWSLRASAGALTDDTRVCTDGLPAWHETTRCADALMRARSGSSRSAVARRREADATRARCATDATVEQEWLVRVDVCDGVGEEIRPLFGCGLHSSCRLGEPNDRKGSLGGVSQPRGLSFLVETVVFETTTGSTLMPVKMRGSAKVHSSHGRETLCGYHQRTEPVELATLTV